MRKKLYVQDPFKYINGNFTFERYQKILNSLESRGYRLEMVGKDPLFMRFRYIRRLKK